MDRLLRKIGNGYFYTGEMPIGYSAEKIEVTNFSLKTKFKSWLKAEKKIKMKLWTNLVLNSGEFDHLSSEERTSALSLKIKPQSCTLRSLKKVISDLYITFIES
jgi:hypothetical protein